MLRTPLDFLTILKMSGRLEKRLGGSQATDDQLEPARGIVIWLLDMSRESGLTSFQLVEAVCNRELYRDDGVTCQCWNGRSDEPAFTLSKEVGEEANPGCVPTNCYCGGVEEENSVGGGGIHLRQMFLELFRCL